ncbi:MAG: hypothetical protein IJH39_08425 [Clostridia bacterium]|nr:hypothetical protein [Clostridia bacterium]
MVRDNFEEVKKYFEFKNEGDFYLVVLYKRRKDQTKEDKFQYRTNSIDVRFNMSIKDFYIFKESDLDKYKEEIITLSKLYNARAYIFLQRKNYKTVYKYTFKYLADFLLTNKWDADVDIMHEAAVECYLDNKNRYLIDLDKEYFSYEKELINYVLKYNDEYKIINSVTGKHIICDKIYESDFVIKYPFIYLHTNKPTILYYDNRK